jgi:uncharacterized protein involved in exopolysaccharide biosynthesis
MKRNLGQAAPRFLPQAEPEPGFSEAPPPTLVAATRREILIDRLWLLWNRRRFLMRATIVGFLGGALFAFLIPQRFESSAELMPPDSHSSSGAAMIAAIAGRAGGLEALGGDLFGLNSSGALFIGILNSRTVQDRIVDRFDLRKVYGCAFEYQARKKLSEHTSVGEDRLSGIITITVNDSDPKRATAIATAYVEELNRLVVDLATSSAHRERVFLEERLKSVKVELDEASKQFSEFSSKNTAIDIKEQGKAMIDATATLTGQLIAAESELRGLEQIYTPSNVRVRSVQARIGELRHQLEQLGGTDPAKPDSNQAPDKNGQASNSLYPPLRKLPLLGVTYADLYRQTKIEETVYETLTQEYELAKVQEAKETPSVKVLDVPIVPEHKSYPPRVEVALVCMVLSFGVAVVWILARARWAEVEALDPGKALAREVIGTVQARIPWKLIPSKINGASNGVHPGVMQWARSAFKFRRHSSHTAPPDE